MTARRLLGPAAKAIRVANKKPQGDVALALDCSQGYLSNVEKGVKQPSEIFMRELADILGVSIDQITYVIPPCKKCAAREQAAAQLEPVSA